MTSSIKIIDPACNARQYIERNRRIFVDLAERFGRNITIAEKGGKILVNSGARTEVLDIMSITSHETLGDFIIHNCKLNDAVEKQGLNALA